MIDDKSMKPCFANNNAPKDESSMILLKIGLEIRIL